MGAAEYVKKKRLERGMSQRQLSVLSGVSNSEISRIESGERRSPSPAVLRAIAAALDVPYEELMSEAGYLEAGGPGGSDCLPEWVYRLPPDLYEFIREESSRGWPYTRLAKGLRRRELDPAELEAVVRTWMQAKKQYEKDTDRRR